MVKLINEDFTDFNISEFPYDLGHSALGEYHHVVNEGYHGNWYDPISLHQYRSMDGSWLITEDDGIKYMEQNRSNYVSNAFKNVYSTLVCKTDIYSSYELSFNVRLFELNNYSGMAISYLTSRDYYAVGINNEGISLYRRYEEEFEIIATYKFIVSDLIDYNIRVCVNNEVLVYLDNKLVLKGNINLTLPSKIALVSKNLCRYSNIVVNMIDLEYNNHLSLKNKHNLLLEEKRKQYPQLECIHKINIKEFSSARQLRIRNVDGKTIFVFAQHQKRCIRDSFAHISAICAFDYDGNILWKKGEFNNSKDNTLISCDLPFQIADINNDGRYEVIYARNFMINIVDLLDGHLIKSMPTPIIHNDPLVKNEPFYRLNVDAIRVADFTKKGYKGDFIIKDRYQNVWAYDGDFNLLWRYHNKNTGHFPYIYDFDNDGYDEMFVGYDYVDHDGSIISSLPYNSDHTDEIIYARLKKDEPKRLILASGNEGFNICNLDGSIYKHNEIGHAQRISVAKYLEYEEGLQIIATSFWGADGIICAYDCNGNRYKKIEMMSNGSVITPVNYDGKHILALLHPDTDGGLVDGNLDIVVQFPNDSHPTLSYEVYDVDNDGIDEIIVWNLDEMWIYKAKEFDHRKEEYIKYPDDSFSNYRGEYLIPKDYD